jgi:hypothetical protein
MVTWLDTQPAATIRRALGLSADNSNKHDGEQFGLWLELVDLHLDQLRTERSHLEWEWRQGYEDGWSPRTAAFAAWAKHLRPVRPPGQGAA